MVLDDRQLKVRELADVEGISRSAVHRVLTENLNVRKLCSRWVPRFPTQERKDISIECLVMFHRNKAGFLHGFIIVGEI